MLCYRCINTRLHTSYKLFIYFQHQFVTEFDFFFLIGHQQGGASGCSKINVSVLLCVCVQTLETRTCNGPCLIGYQHPVTPGNMSDEIKY